MSRKSSCIINRRNTELWKKFTNTNKRRKEEAQKIEQLKSTYGNNIDFVLFLCGYFDSGYLGYEAAEGIDWIWEHRVTDFKKAGV